MLSSDNNAELVERVRGALLKLVRYNPETGVFIRTSGRRKGLPATTRSQTGSCIYVHISHGEGVHLSSKRAAFLLIEGYLPGILLMSADGNPFNDRWSNITMKRKEVREIGNFKHKGKSLNEFERQHKRNTSGVRGVSLHKASGKWRASMHYDGKQRNLGYFDTIEEAEMVLISARERAREINRG